MAASALVGKPCPDIATLVSVTPAGAPAAAKTTLKKFLASKAKTVVLCFVTSGPACNAAIARMEEGAFQKGASGKASFVIVSTDSLKSAQDLHKENAITGCSHVFGEGKTFNVARTPAHVVIKDGKVVMFTEEEVASYMSFVA